MVRVELGKKHTCKECGVKFYDLNKEEPTCPECDALVIIHNTTQDSDLIISKVSKASDNIIETDEENDLGKEIKKEKTKSSKGK